LLQGKELSRLTHVCEGRAHSLPHGFHAPQFFGAEPLKVLVRNSRLEGFVDSVAAPLNVLCGCLAVARGEPQVPFACERAGLLSGDGPSCPVAIGTDRGNASGDLSLPFPIEALRLVALGALGLGEFRLVASAVQPLVFLTDIVGKALARDVISLVVLAELDHPQLSPVGALVYLAPARNCSSCR
jgi:hypothetical protein